MSGRSRPRDSAQGALTIGRYTRLDKIGRGSFATVYQGVHNVSTTHRGEGGLDALERGDRTVHSIKGCRIPRPLHFTSALLYMYL
jgi:hypothetical protein